MSSKRRLRRKACQGKVRHKTDGAAFYAAKQTPGCSHYRCEHCGFFHVGHPRSEDKGLRPGINSNRW